MTEQNQHDASGQLAGYLYQIFSALLLLLKNENPESQICIEKFDDIAIAQNGSPEIMIQTKHQLYKQGSLHDTSVDLWRTIKSWCDLTKKSSEVNQTTDFIIITTAQARTNSAAFFLTNSESRNWKNAHARLCEIAAKNDVKANQEFYSAFNSLTQQEQELLVQKIFIQDGAPNIIDIKKSIMPFIRMTTLPAHEQRVYDKMVGWWLNSIIQCLTSHDPVFISYKQVQQAMYDIGSEYKSDSLPIDVDQYYEPTEEEIDKLLPENRIFISQLSLISLSQSRLKRCIRDYYNAYRQRSQWVREQLLFINDLNKYEKELIDEWDRLFLIMKDNLENYGTDISDANKITLGKKLFDQIENLNLPIRKNISQPFIMRGTYHELANQLKVGWHVDFMNRLCQLLKG